MFTLTLYLSWYVLFKLSGSTAQPKPSKEMNQIPLNPWDIPLQANTGHAPIQRTVENKQHKTPAALKGNFIS